MLTLGKVRAVWNVKQNVPGFYLPGVYNGPGLTISSVESPKVSELAGVDRTTQFL